MATTETFRIETEADLRDLDRAERAIDEIGDATADLRRDADTASDGMERAERSIRNAGNEAKEATGKTSRWGGALQSIVGIVGAVTIALGALGIADKIFDTLSFAADFDATMRNIQSVTGQTNEEIATLGQELNAIGADSIAGPAAVADAYYDVASGVTDASARLATLRAAVALSEAGNSDLKATTAALISVMNSYGFSAEEAAFASDVFTRTTQMGVGTMEEFAGAFPQVTGLANSMNISFDTLAANMAYLTTQGYSASESATLLKSMMSTLLNPTGELTSIIEDLGFESGQAMVDALGLAGSYDAIKEAGDGSFAGIITSQEALQGALALTGEDADQFFSDFMGGVDGATEASREFQRQSLHAQIALIKNRVIAAANAFAQRLVPHIIRGIQFIDRLGDELGRLFKIFNNLRNLGDLSILETLERMTEVLDDGSSIFGTFLERLGVAPEIAQSASQALNVFIDIVQAITSLNPESIAVIGAALLVMAGPMIIAQMTALWVSLTATAAAAWAAAPAFIAAAAPFLILALAIAAYESNFGNLQTNLHGIADAIQNRDLKGALEGVWNVFKDLAVEVGNLIGIDVEGGLAAWTGEDGVFASAGVLIDTLAKKIGDFVANLPTSLSNLATTLTDSFQTPFENVVNWVKTMFTDPKEGVDMLISNLVNNLIPTALSALDGILGTNFRDIFTSSVDVVKALFAGEISLDTAIMTFVNELIPAALGQLDAVLGTNFRDKFTSAVDTVKNKIFGDDPESLKSKLMGLPGGIAEWLGGLPRIIVEALVNPIAEAIAGIGGLISDIINDPIGTLSNIGAGGIDAVQGLLESHVPGFAEGGWTGNAPSGSVAGVVHSREYVVPENGALVLRGGGGGGFGGGNREPIVVPVTVMLDGRVLYEAVKREEGRR